MIKELEDRKPSIDEDTFIAESADVIGDVRMGKGASIWYGSVVRGDINHIEIGENSNIQDNSTVHVDTNVPCIIGRDVTIGHSATVHGCTIGDNSLIGMGSIVLDRAEIGKNCIIAAGALVTEGKVIPDNSLVMGVPGKVVRELTEEEIESNKASSERYENLWRNKYV